MPTQEAPTAAITFAELFESVVTNISRVIQGKGEVIEMVLISLLAEGHLLIEDIPGVGKTTLAKALAASIDTTFGRIQFTPDLLPTDVLGVSVWNRATSEFEFREGPVFFNIVLADEINRASPKTQSALLESMAEAQVTVDGSTYRLNSPFMVMATQNPIEHEGTYPLPDSQLDRFLLSINMGYPGRDAELEILDAHGDHNRLDDISAVVTTNDIRTMITAVRSIHVAPPLKEYLVSIADATRRHPQISLGMSPRATLALQRTARARAAAAGRSFVMPDDIKALAPSVIAHRLIVTPDANIAGIDANHIVEDLLRQVPVPSID